MHSLNERLSQCKVQFYNESDLSQYIEDEAECRALEIIILDKRYEDTFPANYQFDCESDEEVEEEESVDSLFVKISRKVSGEDTDTGSVRFSPSSKINSPLKEEEGLDTYQEKSVVRKNSEVDEEEEISSFEKYFCNNDVVSNKTNTTTENCQTEEKCDFFSELDEKALTLDLELIENSSSIKNL